MNNPPPPPPPPPHGSSSSSSRQNASGGLPPGNYDIFVIPPHSSGSGFLYLPSLQVQRNSFLAGVVCTLAVVGIWVIVVPVVRQWTSTMMSSGGSGVVLIMLGIGVLGWAFGKTQGEMNRGASSNAGRQEGPAPDHPHANAPPPSGANGDFPKSSWHHQQSSSQTNWEKAREDMRKREEERKKKEEAERKAERERWERSRQREREAREKEAREKDSRAKEQKEKEDREKRFQDRLKKEKEAREAREKAAKEAKDREDREKSKSATGNYQKPTAQSYAASEDAYSYRPYDNPRSSPTKMDTNSSYVSQSSYTGTHSTAQTSPTPSQYGPWSNNDPAKVTIKGVFLFSNSFPKPIAQLVVGQGKITQGLVLKLESEGLFIDDDVRKVPQREWDVKAWTLKLIEVSFPLDNAQELINKLTFRKTGDLRGMHILRASVRDAENKKYVFLVHDTEAWKVATGLQRLKRGSQTRSLGTSGLSVNDMTGILRQCGM